MSDCPDIAELIPQTGRMALVERVCDWEEDYILCQAQSHNRPDNPLRHAGCLSVFCGVEYAAQAMAAHANLSSAGSGFVRQKGFLATASGLIAHVDHLDEYAEPLIIHAQRMGTTGSTSLYSFRISAARHTLLEGQLMAVRDFG